MGDALNGASVDAVVAVGKSEEYYFVATLRLRRNAFMFDM